MTAPELRFPEFTTPWREGHAGDAFTNSKAKGEAGLPIWSVTLDRGMVPRDSLDRHMESDAADEKNLRAQPGDLVYNTMRMWQGAVGQATEECMVSPAYVVLHPKKGTCSTFFDYWFNAPHMLHKLGAYSYGLTKDRLRLYYADFSRIPLAIPESEEQLKIAAFLDSVSTKLNLLNREKAELGVFKRATIERLFSRERRFAREDGSHFPEWKRLPFGDIAERRAGAFSPTSSAKKPLLVELENIESNTGTIVNASEVDNQISQKSVFQNGDVLFGKLRPYLRKFAKPDFSGVCSSEIWVLRPKSVSRDFLFYLVQTERFIQRAVVTSSGSKMPRANWDPIVDYMHYVPHPDEQRKIAEALAAIDAKIDAVGAQITQMETFKRGLLQKMFV